MENSTITNQTNIQYRRVSKHPSEQTKQRISASLSGKPKSDLTKQRISQGLSRYWQNPSNFPADSNGGIQEGTGEND